MVAVTSIAVTVGGILTVGGLGLGFLSWIRDGARGWHRYSKLLVSCLAVTAIGSAILFLVGTVIPSIRYSF
jgi:hypothetical protein